ncbi:two-component sensor histidine kinase, partial [Parafrankia sp. FMc2]
MKGTWPASFGARISGLLGRLVGAHGRWSGVDGVAAVAAPRRSAVTMLIDRIPSARARRVAVVVVADIVPTAAVGAIMLGASGHAAREQVPPSRPLDGTAYVLLGLATFLFPLRRHFSLLLFAVEALLLGAYIATGYPHGPPGAALIVVAFTVGLRAPECRAAGAAKAGAVLLVLATVVAYARGYVSGGWGLASAVVSVLCVVVVPTVLGTLLRVRRLASARAKEDETRRRIDQERLRMAR